MNIPPIACNKISYVLASFLSISNAAWLSKLVLDPLMEEESLLVEGEGRDIGNSPLLCLCIPGG